MGAKLVYVLTEGQTCRRYFPNYLEYNRFSHVLNCGKGRRVSGEKIGSVKIEGDKWRRNIGSRKNFSHSYEPTIDARSLFRPSFRTASKSAGPADFNFHDPRHYAINNLRRAGNDFFEIMAMSGHGTMSVCKWYNLVAKEEFKEIKWHDQVGKSGEMDTYMDTSKKKGLRRTP